VRGKLFQQDKQIGQPIEGTTLARATGQRRVLACLRQHAALAQPVSKFAGGFTAQSMIFASQGTPGAININQGRGVIEERVSLGGALKRGQGFGFHQRLLSLWRYPCKSAYGERCFAR
jgi:hypothetical protein